MTWMPLDNPQLEIKGNPAWRIRFSDPAVVEPFYGEPQLGEVAVTTQGVYRLIAKPNLWNEYLTVDTAPLIGMLRMWLGAKQGWDNERRILKNKIAVLTELIEGTAIPKLRASGRPDTADYLTENLETVKEG
jgi:hypothetical protein